MNWSLPLTRLRGIDIRIHSTFVLILVWAAWFWGFGMDAGLRGALYGVVATLLLFACVTLRDLLPRAALDAAQLGAILARLHRDYTAESPGPDWQPWYAERLGALVEQAQSAR